MADENGPAAALRAQTALLGQKFVQRTTEEVAVIRNLIEDAAPGDTTVLPKVERMAHKIHGSGATFGFPNLSECAGAVEHLIEEWLRGDLRVVPELGTPERQKLTECLGRLVLAVKAVSAAGSVQD